MDVHPSFGKLESTGEKGKSKRILKQYRNRRDSVYSYENIKSREIVEEKEKRQIEESKKKGGKKPKYSKQTNKNEKQKPN